MTVDVIFPCLNEVEAIPLVLSLMPEGYRAIVVDNGSTDGSGDLARSLGATVVTETRKGFGSAVNRGLLEATSPVVAICDLDATLDPGDIQGLVRSLQGGYDMVLGRRRAVSWKAWSPSQRLANFVLSYLVRSKAKIEIHDLAPMRVMYREAVLDLNIQDRRSGYPLEMVLLAAKKSWKIAERDVPYKERIGKSKVTGTLRGTLTAILDMSRLIRAFS